MNPFFAAAFTGAFAVAETFAFAGDDGFAAGREFVEDEEERGGVVVDDEGRAAEDGFEQGAGVDVAAAALAGGEVVFEVSVAGGGGEAGQGGAAEVGVEDDAGGVDDGAQGRGLPGGEGGGGGLFDGVGERFAAEEGLAGGVEDFADDGQGVGVVVGGDAELRQEFVDGGEIPRSHVFTVAVRGIWGIATYYGCVRAGKTLQLKIRGVAQPGRAPGSGPGGRRFESSRPDHLFPFTSN